MLYQPHERVAARRRPFAPARGSARKETGARERREQRHTHQNFQTGPTQPYPRTSTLKGSSAGHALMRQGLAAGFKAARGARCAHGFGRRQVFAKSTGAPHMPGVGPPAGTPRIEVYRQP